MVMNERRSRLIVALALATSTLAGCGAAAQGASQTATIAPVAVTATAVPTAVPTVAPTAAPTPTPVPTPDLKAIGTQYLAVAAVLNASIHKLNAEIDAAPNDAALVLVYKEFATAWTTAHAGMKAITFPVPLYASVTELLAAYDALAAAYTKLAGDPSLDPGTEITDAGSKMSKAATEIRAFLGLPPPTAP
jgi:hypothetical protein